LKKFLDQLAYLRNEHKLLRCPEYWITVPVCPNLWSCSATVLMTLTTELIGGRLAIFCSFEVSENLQITIESEIWNFSNFSYQSRREDNARY
jgi:hypothetical protein